MPFERYFEAVDYLQRRLWHQLPIVPVERALQGHIQVLLEHCAAFMQGQVGIYFDGVNFANQFEDPAKSKIAGKVGHLVLPAGPGGHHTCTFTNAMAVSAAEQEQGGGVPVLLLVHEQAERGPRALAGVAWAARRPGPTPRSRRSRRCPRAGTTRIWSR